MSKIIPIVNKIRKRDNRVVPFEQERITNAIFKAAESVGGTDRKRAQMVSDEVILEINKNFKKGEIPTVEQIQDIVEKVLIELGHAKTAKSYILYRDLHSKIRNIKSLIDADELIRNYIESVDWRVKENSNMAYSWQGLNNHISSSVQANYWLFSIYSSEISNAHINADLHIHDLGMLSVYCCGWDLKQLLVQGFNGVPGKVACAPPKHLRTALGQSVNFLYTLQHEAAGAQAFSSFDTLLAPFVRYDKLSYKEVKQSLQEFIFNMNVPTRVGCQTPFTNITMDLKPSGTLAEENVIIGGKVMPEKYKDFQKEVDMINKAFAEVMIEGDASGRVFTFPIPTYNLTKDFEWKDKTHDSIWEMTAKYGIPYFSNFINSDMDPDDARSMCCRLRIDNRELKKRGGGLFGSNPLTGSIGVVTINLPRLGYTSKTETEFYEKLGKLMDIAKESLVIKRRVLEEFTLRGLYPYSRVYLKDIYERFGQYWKNHFNTIGLNGMNEACLNLIGKGIDTKEGRDFALSVLDFMRDRIGMYQEETGHIFNLEATPAEGTSYRFAKHDLKQYKDIIVANDKEVKHNKAEPYYTNSSQLPVDATDDIFEALDNQDELQTKYTGGTVLHFFLGEKMPSVQSTKALVKKIAENYHLPYFSITPTFSVCPIHGYLPGEHEFCPKCDDEIGYVENTNAEELREKTDVSN